MIYIQWDIDNDSHIDVECKQARSTVFESTCVCVWEGGQTSDATCQVRAG